MSSGTFGYPLCFSAMLAAIGLFVSIPKMVPVTSSAERAAYQEIAKLYKNENFASLMDKCERFLMLYPHSKGAEAVATILGESFVRSENWKEVLNFYRRLETKFPHSDNLDRYIFFQALASFQCANFAESTPMMETFLKRFPNSPLVENARYYLAMSNFLSNKYKETLASCYDYLKEFPDGRYAGDMRYRLSFIDFNDKEKDQSAKIVCDLSEFLKEHPDDLSNGSIYCLMADTYKRMGKQDEALDSYIKALWTDSADDVLQYAIDSAIAILWERKDLAGIAKLHDDFMQRRPDSPLALRSVSWVAKIKVREGKGEEAVELLLNFLKDRIANPDNEQVDLLIDELVKVLTPRKKTRDIDIDALDKQLVEILNKTIGGKGNPTTAARVCYARARLAQLLRHNDRSDLYLKGIATTNAKDPSGLSPVLLAACGEILLKSGDIAGAESMFQRLKEHFPKADYAEAGLIGLGNVALARKKPDVALGIFEGILKKPDNTRFKEASLGKLQALVDLDQLEAAEKLGTEIVNDRKFRGELAAKAYLQLARIYRKQGAKTEGEKAREWLEKAYDIYIRIRIAYQAFPDLNAEGIWQAAEVAKELGDEDLRQENLKALLEHPKLKNTDRRKQAEMEK